jgi:uncharacterized protein (UPF0297 family)
MNVTESFKIIWPNLWLWFEDKRTEFTYEDLDSKEIHMLLRNLAVALYNGWHCDWKMNSSDKDIVFEGTKQGLQSNKIRNKILEEIERFYLGKQKKCTEFTSESLAMCFDKAIILWMKLYNAKNEETKNRISQELEFVLKCGDKLYDDIIEGRKNIRVFTHIKEYM